MLDEIDKLPISDFYETIRYATISKSSKWWSFIILFKARSKTKIGLYLFHRKNKNWKRKHKFTISSIEQYNDIKRVLEEYTKFL